MLFAQCPLCPYICRHTRRSSSILDLNKHVKIVHEKASPVSCACVLLRVVAVTSHARADLRLRVSLLRLQVWGQIICVETHEMLSLADVRYAGLGRWDLQDRSEHASPVVSAWSVVSGLPREGRARPCMHPAKRRSCAEDKPEALLTLDAGSRWSCYGWTMAVLSGSTQGNLKSLVPVTAAARCPSANLS